MAVDHGQVHSNIAEFLLVGGQVLAAVAEGLCQMDAADGVHAVEIGEGPGEFQDPVIAAGAQGERFGRLAQKGIIRSKGSKR